MLDERAAETLIAMRRRDGQVGNMADASSVVLPSGDVASNLPLVLRDEYARRIAGHIIVDMAGLAPPPVVAIDDSKRFFDAVVDRNTGKALDRKPLKFGNIGGLKVADM